MCVFLPAKIFTAFREAFLLLIFAEKRFINFTAGFILITFFCYCIIILPFSKTDINLSSIQHSKKKEKVDRMKLWYKWKFTLFGVKQDYVVVNLFRLKRNEQEC